MSDATHGPQAALIRFAIRFRYTVLVLAGVLLAYGIYQLRQAKYDVFPEFAPPQVTIQTEAPGLAPEQVETLVTQPLENILNGTPDLKTLRSTSIQGLSVIVVTFNPASDIYRDRQLVAERLSEAAATLPSEIRPPSMTPLTSSTSTVLLAGLTSGQRSLMEMRTVAEWTIRPRLLAVPGVAKVAIFGGEAKSIQILVHPDQLIRFGIGLDDILSVAKRAAGVRGAGFIDTPNQRVTLRTDSQALTPADLAGTVVLSRGSGHVTLGDVADVEFAPAPPTSAASINGEASVQFVISEQYGASTAEVTTAVEAALAELTPALQRDGIVLHSDLFRPATFIDAATRNVQSSLLLGGLLVIAVLFLFLFDLRAATISCLTIPLALLAAVIVLEYFGVTLNTMTLGGLAIAIGVVVDDAVIDVENIVRRLRENRQRSAPQPSADVVLQACLEVRSAVVYGTFAVILVVLPMLALSGIAGRLFGPLGVAYLLAVTASLLVALTVTPALSMMLLARTSSQFSEPPLLRWSKQRYQMLLERAVRRPRAIYLVASLLILASLAALPFFGASFVPELKEGHFIVHMSAAPGTSLQESQRLGGLVSRALHELPAVRSVSQQVGRAEQADDTWGTHYSEFNVDLKPLGGEAGEFIQSDIRRILGRFTGVNFTVKPFLTERVEEALSGYTAAVVVNIYGSDLDQLDAKAREVSHLLATVPGATDVQIQSPTGTPQLGVRLRGTDLQRWGLDPLDALDLIRTGYEGATVGSIYEGNKTVDIRVILAASSRQSPMQVKALPIRTPDGHYLRLEQIADIFATSGRYQVAHQGARRVQTITSNVSGRDPASFVMEARETLAKLSLPPGSYLEFAGEAQAQAQARRDLLFNSTVTGIGVVLLLSLVMRSAANLLLVLVNLPFALVGGVLAVFATGGLLSLGSMVGFLTVFGITLRNSILMMAHYEHLVTAERASWGLATALRGAADRLTPIVMTSLVTALGVLPLAIGMQEPGREVEGPMAVVILGGLLTSMALNLLVLPLLALRFGRFGSGQPLPIIPPRGLPLT